MIMIKYPKRIVLHKQFPWMILELELSATLQQEFVGLSGRCWGAMHFFVQLFWSLSFPLLLLQSLSVLYAIIINIIISLIIVTNVITIITTIEKKGWMNDTNYQHTTYW